MSLEFTETNEVGAHRLRMYVLAVTGLLIRAVVAVSVGLLTLFAVDRAFGAINGPVVKPVNAMGLTTGISEAGTHLRPGFEGRYRNAEYSISIAVNSRGLRGPEIAYPKAAGIYRILALGDSFTFGQGVEFDDAWPEMLEARTGPGTEVLNAGWAAGSPIGHLRFLTDSGPELDADLVLVAVFVGNDVVEDLAERNAGQDPIERIEFEARYIENLQLRVGAVGRVRDFLDAAFPNLYELATLAVVKTQYLLGGHRSHFDYVLAEDEGPELSEGWMATLAALRDIDRAAGSLGARSGVVIIPFYDQVAGTSFGAGYEVDRPQRRILAHCERAGLDCLDLLPTLRSAGPAAELYYLKDGHWTVKGHEIASAAIAEWLRERRLLR